MKRLYELNGKGQSIRGIANDLLLAIHEQVFGDEPFAGRWRDIQVVVGPLRPPPSLGFSTPQMCPIFADGLRWKAYLPFGARPQSTGPEESRRARPAAKRVWRASNRGKAGGMTLVRP